MSSPQSNECGRQKAEKLVQCYQPKPMASRNYSSIISVWRRTGADEINPDPQKTGEYLMSKLAFSD
jgi:hypothetical protein